MAFKWRQPRVKESSTTTGTGDYALDGAASGYQAFSALASAGDLVPVHVSMGANWEEGIYTYQTGPARLERTTILRSSNSGAAVSWGAGTKTLRVGLPSAMAVLRHKHTADITSSATVDLNAVIGDYVTVTGTTGITAITLEEHREVTVRFSGVLTLTNGASLVLPGAANLTTEAGDIAVFRGEATGVVRCLDYQKANGMPVAGGFGFKNKIIGGDFTTNPWQRGTTFTAPATITVSADCWKIGYVTSAVVDIFKTTDAPTPVETGGHFTQHCLHIDVTTADASIAATDQMNLQNIIEGLNAAPFGFGQAGTRYVTLSFWVKAAKTGIHCVSLQNSAADRAYVKEYTVNTANTWEKKILTFPVDTTGTWLYDTGIGLRVRFALATGANFQTTANTWAAGNFHATSNQVNELDDAANNFKLALVQLEAGTVATPFEARDVGTELALCQRYLPAVFSNGSSSATFCSGQCFSTTQAVVYVPFQTTARTAPTGITASNVAHVSVRQAGSTLTAATNTQFQASTLYGCELAITLGSAVLVAGDATIGALNNSAGYILFTGCEL